MKVFKFGGASLRDAANVKNVASILQRYKQYKLVIIVSAMGKTTNALEAVIAAHAKQNGEAHALYTQFKNAHYAIMQELLRQTSRYLPM
jgi:aspartate kinase